MMHRWPKWREFPRWSPEFPLDDFDISRHGQARSMKILAGLPFEKQVLAPLWFALKSRLLRHFSNEP